MNNSSLKKTLTLQELGILQSEMLKKQKNKEAAWGLWAGLSFFGAHRFYTENYGYASAMLTTSLIPIIAIILLSSLTDVHGIFAIMFSISIFLLIGSVIWSWIDAFFLNRRIETLNEQIELKILQTIVEGR